MPSIEKQVSANSDDCERSTDILDYFSVISNNFSVGKRDSQYKDLGSAARFLDVTVPAGVTITQANLKATANLNIAINTVNTRIRCERTINPSTFSDKADFDARTWTTAKVNWDAIAGWTRDVEYTSPDIKTCVQEVIDLPGWASGNPMAVLWDDFEQRGTYPPFTHPYRRAYSYNGSNAKAPKLYIEYAGPSFADIDTRFHLEVPSAYADADGRFHLMVQGYADVATRFCLTTLPYYADVATRFHLQVPVGYVDISTRFHLASPVPGLPYILEIHDSSGNLVSILENAHNINYSQLINAPHVLQFDLPAKDTKAGDVVLANEIWLRDGRTNVVVRKFLLKRTGDVRQ